MWQTLGFETTKKFFENAVANGQLSHAYLFAGQEMIGKRTFALELAEKISNKRPRKVPLRGRQETGGKGNQMNLDVLLVSSDHSENKASIAIEDMRKAKNFLSLSPAVGPYKFVIIDNADQMTTEAQNAFLKILEEASPSSIIILVSAFAELLLPTIVSRCQEIHFASHSTSEIKQVLQKEGIGQERAEFLSKFVNGRVGLALKITRENGFDKLKACLEEFVKIKKQLLSGRLKIGPALAEEEKLPELKEKILYWLLYLRMQSLQNHHASLTNLNQLIFHLQQPQFNRRLMIEDFLIKL